MAIHSVEHYYRNGEWLKPHHCWIPLDNINPDMVMMTILGEDIGFFYHKGLDLEAIKYAYIINKHEKKIVWGGSTISQQTAKNVFLYANRTYLRKVLETYYTILIELIWGKKRILEVYLNSAEMGDNIYGIESCAKDIFGKTSQTLNPKECAMIVSMLPYAKKDYKNPNPYCLESYQLLLMKYDFFTYKK